MNSVSILPQHIPDIGAEVPSPVGIGDHIKDTLPVLLGFRRFYSTVKHHPAALLNHARQIISVLLGVAAISVGNERLDPRQGVTCLRDLYDTSLVGHGSLLLLRSIPAPRTNRAFGFQQGKAVRPLHYQPSLAQPTDCASHRVR